MEQELPNDSGSNSNDIIKYELSKNMSTISESDYKLLCSKQSLSETELANAINYALTHNQHVVTLNIENLTERNITVLAKLFEFVHLTNEINGFVLDSLKGISPKASKLLGRFSFLSLYGLETINHTTAKNLSNVRFLYLDGLREISKENGKALGEKEYLSMTNIKIDPELINDTFSSIMNLYLADGVIHSRVNM